MVPRSRQPSPRGDEEQRGASFRILFVCTGNTCRSPMAEAIARREVERRGWRFVEVASAGVAAHAGAPASAEAVRVAAEAGLFLEEHRARPLSPELLERADLVLTMSPAHLAKAGPAGGGDRAHLLSEFAGLPTESGIADPFGGSVQRYRDTFRELEQLVRAALDRVEPFVAP